MANRRLYPLAAAVALLGMVTTACSSSSNQGAAPTEQLATPIASLSVTSTASPLPSVPGLSPTASVVPTPLPSIGEAASPSPEETSSVVPSISPTAQPSPSSEPTPTASASPSSVAGDRAALSWYYLKKGAGIVPGFPKEVKAYGPERKAVYVGAGHKVYLTFDSGGSLDASDEFLAILRKYDVKATFFLVGYNVKKDETFIKKLLQEGHLVANHTMSHPDMTKLTDEEVDKEIQGFEALFQEVTGQPPAKLFRFPYGKYSLHLLEKLTSMGYTSAFWSTAMRDWEPRKNGPEDAYRDVMNGLHDGNIILMHLGSDDNLKALDRILQGIQEQGYTFGLLTDFSS
ncbi:polysaccharide deacetylase family protein [Gorillibacterium sp. CAU 1737]|uniref:polysaccharide deacetylase family protein n=1 Tax=Gorillibacterium sp. CAU 1737 TaxID=3140362 RepID=UPI00326077AA